MSTGSGIAMLKTAAPIGKYLKGKHRRLRLLFHSGSDKDLIDVMEKYGMIDQQHAEHALNVHAAEGNYSEWLSGWAMVDEVRADNTRYSTRDQEPPR